MRWRWPWQCDEGSTEPEARAAMQKLERREHEVQRLHEQLRNAQRQNHFAEMVDRAIARTRERE